MIEELKRWWQARTPRERTMLAALAPLALALLVWLALLRPLSATVDEARERHEARAAHLAQVRALDSSIRKQRQGRSSAPLPAPLEALVAQAAAEAGFPIAALASEAPGQVRFTIEAARPQAFFVWLHQLSPQGAKVERMSAVANADRTLRVDVTLKAGEA